MEKEEVKPGQGIIRHDSIFLLPSEEVKELRERGFGEYKRRRVYLTACESFYLLDKGRIEIKDEDSGKLLDLEELVRRMDVDRDEIWIKYLIYRDLRDRGYIVRESKKVDFEIQGKGALRRLVSIIHEGRDTSLDRLSKLLGYANREKKELVLAVIDRRTDIVYYTLESLEV